MTLVSSGIILERSIPLRSGIWMSQNIKSTGFSWMKTNASLPFVKEPFRSRKGVFLTYDSISWTASGSSSITMQLIVFI